MDLHAPDVIRFLIFAVAGVGAAFMVATNAIAYNVLRPPKKLGFLWWHVLAISLGFIFIGVVALDNILLRIGEPITWRVPVGFIGFTLFAVAQVIIFLIERGRLSQKKALERNLATPPAPLVSLDPVTPPSEAVAERREP